MDTREEIAIDKMLNGILYEDFIENLLSSYYGLRESLDKTKNPDEMDIGDKELVKLMEATLEEICDMPENGALYHDILFFAHFEGKDIPYADVKKRVIQKWNISENGYSALYDEAHSQYGDLIEGDLCENFIWLLMDAGLVQREVVMEKSMSITDALSQLDSLKQHCMEFVENEPDGGLNVYGKDVAALNAAMYALKHMIEREPEGLETVICFGEQ